MKGLLITVEGRVQGVGFRYFTCNKAKELGIKGYAKNCVDGSVKILAFGKNLNQFLENVKQGPSLALVTNINITDYEISNSSNYTDFRIKY